MFVKLQEFTIIINYNLADTKYSSYSTIYFFSFQVNMQSLSEAAGLQPGDLILAVNGRDLGSLRHKEAQEAIVKSGNNFSLTIMRYKIDISKNTKIRVF